MTWGSRIGIVAVAAAMALGGCGSDDAFVGQPGPGPGNGNGGNGGTPPPPAVESILLLVDPPVLASGAIDNADGVTVTAIARSAGNVVMPDVTITFSADSGALAVPNPVTNANGRATATLTTGGDPRNRTINVSAGSGAVQTSITVDVAGTQLAIAGPSSVESGETETFTVTLRDSAGRGIRDVTVNASSQAGNVVSPGAATTNASGVATFSVTGSVGGEDTLTFSGLGLTATRALLVSRYGIVFHAPDAGVERSLGSVVTVTAELREDGAPLAGETLQFSATRGTLSAFSATTGGDGRATVTLTSSGANGAGPVMVTAVGPEGVARKRSFEFVATTPTGILLQPAASTVPPQGSTTLTAIVHDADGNPVKNQTVRFALEDVSGGQLSASTAVTDTQGAARTTYVASAASSPTQGVRVIADVGDPVVATDDVRLTVAAPAVFITLGTDNRIQKNDADATYSKVYSALVVDAAGNPAPANTVLNLTLRSLEYQKGFYDLDPSPSTDPWFQVLTVPGTDAFFGTPNPNAPPAFGPYFGAGPFGCRTEDPLGTGNVNLANDYNGNGQIDPANVAIAPATVELDENGVGTFVVRWPQSYATWVLSRLTATATVAGTESARRLDFVLSMSASDVQRSETPPNIISPFGVAGDCTDPN